MSSTAATPPRCRMLWPGNRECRHPAAYLASFACSGGCPPRQGHYCAQDVAELRAGLIPCRYCGQRVTVTAVGSLPSSAA